jgi:hypothetical protein
VSQLFEVPMTGPRTAPRGEGATMAPTIAPANWLRPRAGLETDFLLSALDRDRGLSRAPARRSAQQLCRQYILAVQPVHISPAGATHLSHRTERSSYVGLRHDVLPGVITRTPKRSLDAANSKRLRSAAVGGHMPIGERFPRLGKRSLWGGAPRIRGRETGSLPSSMHRWHRPVVRHRQTMHRSRASWITRASEATRNVRRSCRTREGCHEGRRYGCCRLYRQQYV